MTENTEDFFATYKPVRDKGRPSLPLNKPCVPINGLADVGIELEVEGSRLPSSGYFDAVRGKASACRWSRKEDGSLRSGYEYVLSTPCYENEIDDVVNGFYNVLKEYRTSLVLSNRCSTHIHLNVGGYKLNELTSLVTMWHVFEAALLEWCGEERKTNHFCLSHKDTNALSDAWFDYLSTGRRKFSRMKYSSLNVATLDTFGSVEFRCGPAFETADGVIKWAKFLKGLQNYCKKEFSCPSHIAYSLSERGPEEMLRQICSDAGIPEFANEILEANIGKDFERECMKGFRSFQKNTLGFPWEEWMPLINKAFVPDPFEKPSASRTNLRSFGTRLRADFTRQDLDVLAGVGDLPPQPRRPE